MPQRWIVSYISDMIGCVTRALVLLVALAGCGRAPSAEPAKIIDLSTAVAELRADFDAHRDEARFVTLLAPT